MKIDIDLKFRAVGQGAFYTGIFNGHKKISFVYDCGTHSSRQYIEKEVEEFVREIDNQKIDILIISHFHADHINYISHLLKETGGAKYAILPYLTAEELYVAYIDAYSKATVPSAETLSFIENPTNFLVERNVERIIYIHPSGGDNSEEDNEPNLPIIFSGDNIVSEDLILFNNLIGNNNFQNKNLKVQHCFDLGNLFLAPFWEFKFFNKPRNSTVLSSFLIDIKILLGVKTISFSDIAKYIKANPNFEKEFNDIYSKNMGARALINDTSLVVYHGPTLKYFLIKYKQKRPRRSLSYKTSGTLLTGDIIFDSQCFNDLKARWIDSKYILNVGIFQIPHHGAENYIYDIVIKNYNNVNWWVINFGLGNQHKHPRQNTLDMIINNKLKGEMFANTQINQFYYGCILIHD